MYENQVLRMLGHGARLLAIVTIFGLAESGRQHLAAADGCETTFLFCTDTGSCGSGAVCTFGQCTGTVTCMGGPGCTEGNVALICEIET
jgi:hypothetical protein